MHRPRRRLRLLPASLSGNEIRYPRFFLGETYGFWTQTGVLLLGALLTVLSVRFIERKKAAAEVLFRTKSDRKLSLALRKIGEIHHSQEKIAKYGAKPVGEDKVIGNLINYALTHFEYVSIGIQEGIYDQKIFKRSQYGTVMRLYERTKPFINVVRKEIGSETLYMEFEWLSCEWKKKPLKLKKISSIVN